MVIKTQSSRTVGVRETVNIIKVGFSSFTVNAKELKQALSFTFILIVTHAPCAE